MTDHPSDVWKEQAKHEAEAYAAYAREIPTADRANELALAQVHALLYVGDQIREASELRLSGSSWNFGGDPHGLMVRR